VSRLSHLGGEGSQPRRLGCKELTKRSQLLQCEISFDDLNLILAWRGAAPGWRKLTLLVEQCGFHEPLLEPGCLLLEDLSAKKAGARSI